MHATDCICPMTVNDSHYVEYGIAVNDRYNVEYMFIWFSAIQDTPRGGELYYVPLVYSLGFEPRTFGS